MNNETLSRDRLGMIPRIGEEQIFFLHYEESSEESFWKKQLKFLFWKTILMNTVMPHLMNTKPRNELGSCANITKFKGCIHIDKLKQTVADTRYARCDLPVTCGCFHGLTLTGPVGRWAPVVPKHYCSHHVPPPFLSFGRTIQDR